MAISFKCPACGAPLSYSGGDETTVQCAYCSNTVGVPAELRPAPAPAPAPAPSDGSAAPALLVPLPPTPPDDIRAAIKQMRQTRRLERRLARHEARVLRRH